MPTGKTTTGFVPVLGNALAARAQELLRRGHYGHSELTNDPVASGLPRTFDVIRMRKTAAGSSAARIPPTWAAVAGLHNIGGSLWTPSDWMDRESETEIQLRASERMISLVDIPATATELKDRLLLSDLICLDDPVYGARSVFEVIEIGPIVAGIIHARLRYAHKGEACTDPPADAEVPAGVVRIDSLLLIVDQEAHGFSKGQVLRATPTEYALADAAAEATAEIAGVVLAVDGADRFELRLPGGVIPGLGLTSGTTYFLSAATPGAMVTPQEAGSVNKPVALGLPGDVARILGNRAVTPTSQSTTSLATVV